MRRPVHLLSLFIVPALLFTAACGGDDDAGSDSALPAVTAGKKFGEQPTVEKGEGDPPTKLTTEVLSEGDGATIKKGDNVAFDYLGQVWGSGTSLGDTYTTKQPMIIKAGEGSPIKGWDQALQGKKAGSRIETVIPPDLAFGKEEQSGIPADSTLVFVIDIKGTYPDTATGNKVAQGDASLPRVGTNTDGEAPSIEVPKGKDAPKKLVSNYVLEGDGKEVKKTDTVVVQYKGVVWKTGKQFDSSWDRGMPTSFSLSGVVKGWTDGLSGKKVGSRVLLVIPPDLGYGDQEQSGIPANSTLVFAVDIVGTM